MAAGKASDFKIYHEYMQTRINEVLAQRADLFNAASGGAIRLTSVSKRGDYEYKSFFQSISGLASRRDTTSVSDANDLPMTQEELVSVKLNRKIGPVAQTRDAFRKLMARFDQTEFSGLVAEQAATAMQIEMLDTGLLAARAALRQQTASYFTQSSLGTMDTLTLIDGLAKMGDRADRVVCWVMHSKVYYNLVKEQVVRNIDGVSNFNVASGTPITLNRPVIVTDSASLKTQLNSPDVDNYFTLGLTADAVICEDTEQADVVVDDVTGKENLIVRYQGEYAYNLGVKGFKWDVANGAANPNSTAVALGTNWDVAFSDVKDRAGVCIMTL